MHVTTGWLGKVHVTKGKLRVLKKTVKTNEFPEKLEVHASRNLGKITKS
jgi:hypothetical protein